ncbi:hypothetical protein Maq22A_c00260 [Methylobacterium aquaticum]|uniref:Uncharacterized protein n=1 Tax=Methylobacterium aquaticum TaxID=270351 RepID=A0A0C6EU69_9HYPH|nr:hypothetical protein Maq22A_c00260 [Methylobacterium aquaticum]
MAVMQVGGRDGSHHQAAVGVGQRIAFVPNDALGGIIAAHALDTDAARARGLRIQDGSCQTGLASDPWAILRPLARDL